MKRGTKGHCKEIVAKLVDQFWAKHKGELEEKCSKVDADSINHGLFNSTGPVADKARLHRQCLKDLSGFLVASLENEYPHVRPAACVDELQQILQSEYDKLVRKIPAWLQSANLLQKNISSSFESGLAKDCEEAKASIANACALWEERWKAKKVRERKKVVKYCIGLFLAIATLVATVLGLFHGG